MKEGDEVLVVFRQRAVRGILATDPYTITPLRLVDVEVDWSENEDGLLEGCYDPDSLDLEDGSMDGRVVIQVAEYAVRPLDAVTRLADLG